MSARESRLFFLINQAQRVLYRAVDQLAQTRAGAPVVQVAALLAIPREGAQLNEIGASLRLNGPATTGLVARMTRAGLVEKQRSERDGRATVVRVTAHGLEVRQRALPLVADMNNRLAAGFTDAELDVIIRFLNQILTLWTASDSRPHPS